MLNLHAKYGRNVNYGDSEVQDVKRKEREIMWGEQIEAIGRMLSAILIFVI